ncbi:MAG TPA: hypothetical protein VM425_12530 [Myxococcota bacterium]|nr:hypothetical protein [Myxococcota bacterium]
MIVKKKTVLFIIVSVLFFGRNLPAEQGALRLQALQVTSGEHAGNLLDGKEQSGWQPAGDPRLEGVLFRFEDSTGVSHVDITSCPGSTDFDVIPFVNSVRGRVSLVKGSAKIFLSAKGDLSLRSLFLRFNNAKAGACIGEVTFFRGRTRLDVKPPRAARAGVEVSSTLKPEAAYHKSYLFDQSVDYGWVEGVAGLGKGERITVTFDKPQEITGIQIYNGYQRSMDHFHKNARVAGLRVSADQGSVTELAVPDRQGASVLDWSSKGKIKKLTLEIAKTKAGTRYQDLVISELRFSDKNGYFTIETDDQAKLSSDLKKSLTNQPMYSVMDRQYESFCRLYSGSVVMAEDRKLSDFGLRKLRLRSNHRFVYYSQIAAGDEAKIVSESIEGIWVPRSNLGKQGPWSKVDLYARRQQIGQDINMNYEVITKNTKTRIVGGSLRIARVEDLGRKRLLELVRRWEKSPARFKVACKKDRISFFGNNYSGDRDLCRDDDRFTEIFNTLVGGNAIVVEGMAITDLFY